TNGKTSVVQFTSQILEDLGEKTGWITTISFKIGKRIIKNATKMTVPNIWRTQKIMRDAAKSGCDYFLLEATTHAIDQNRLWGISFSAVGLTNVTRDHLDYHKTFENYLNTKLKIFNQYIPAVINLDDENWKRFADKSDKTILYSLSHNVIPSEVEESLRNYKGSLDSKLQFLTRDDNMSAPNILGEFNQSNVLCAVGLLMALGFNKEEILPKLINLQPVRGRLELIDCGQPYKIIIDYAHTPDAFEKLYATIKTIKKQNAKIIHVFGATGDRDKGKRPMLGKIAEQNANIIILTDEDPYSENPGAIIAEIKSGISSNFKNLIIEIDREKAIEKALKMAQKDDIVLFTGKGHEEVMAVSDGSKHGFRLVPFNEKAIVAKLIKKKKLSLSGLTR
ncbi:MAG: UDP-N-acetylmuramyl tripeptide synthetase, partial [Candidatus Berkelbacteria bacterium Licking1014_85]